jgi:hypothetical protein
MISSIWNYQGILESQRLLSLPLGGITPILLECAVKGRAQRSVPGHGLGLLTLRLLDSLNDNEASRMIGKHAGASHLFLTRAGLLAPPRG